MYINNFLADEILYKKYFIEFLRKSNFDLKINNYFTDIQNYQQFC